jgi:ABC-type Fe3+-hydroxamate transport system substrate-binding protein
VVRVVDCRGVEIRFAAVPRRIVSLVPSHTESLFAMGAGERVVGVTEYCVHPEPALRGVPRVGGTKTPDLDAIAELRPELVIANREENRRIDVERLEAAGFAVWVSYARGVEEAIGEIETLGALCDADEAAGRLAARCRGALERARARAPRAAVRYLALIWKDPYMAVGPDTFAHHLLATCGGENPLPRGAARRYPRIELGEIEALDPEVILLPTEPYRFREHEREPFLELDCRAARSGRVHVVEGELLSWYGPRIPRALATFGELFHGAS